MAAGSLISLNAQQELDSAQMVNVAPTQYAASVPYVARTVVLDRTTAAGYAPYACPVGDAGSDATTSDATSGDATSSDATSDATSSDASGDGG